MKSLDRPLCLPGLVGVTLVSANLKQREECDYEQCRFPNLVQLWLLRRPGLCMFAIAVNALYTTLHKRGTTRQLAGAIVTCVLSALLLLPAIVWYNGRFGIEQAAISVAEVEVALVYVALFGWFLPLSVTVSYCLFSLPRTSTTALHIPRQKHTRTTRANAATALNPP